ncbi:MAG: RluA family pseudouridine synthase [Lachnospiraceae bacterium]|nr:RluA family pseudouridine synthase [Lachnospiraceae bacterium]
MENADIGNPECWEDEDFSITVTEQNNGWRIDKLLSQQREELSRSYIQKLIGEGRVLVGGQTVKAGFKVSPGMDIRIFLPEPEELTAQPENIPLDILYEDEDVILVNKGKNMVVHPAAGHAGGTLVNALLYHCKGQLSAINGVLRPGIVHRIDRNTTGVIVACKNDKAHQSLSEQLKVHSIIRKYNAIVYGAFDEEAGRIEGAVGRHPVDRKKMAVNEKNGKPAVTNYTVLENFGRLYAHVECCLETGRTHQIRVHMSHIHHPLLGDDLYGPAKNPFHLEGQALHARVLGFIHPSSGKYMEFTAPLPEYFTALADKLRKR